MQGRGGLICWPSWSSSGRRRRCKAQAVGGAVCCCMRRGRWGAGGAVCWRGDLVQVVQGGGIIGAARGAGLLLAVVVIIGAAQVVQGAGCGADLLAAHVERVQGEKKKPRAAAQVVRVSLLACVVGAGLLLIRQGRGGAALPFAGGVRFSTLPGSALGVGLELSEL